MIIINYGVSCFKIQSGNTVLVIDPYTKESGLTPPRFQADIVLVTQNHPLHANTSTLTGAPFLITGAGEYEVKGIMIEGVSANERTVYVLEWESMRLCHLGAYSEKNIPDSVLERIGTPDILFLPVGSNGALDAEEAVHVMNLIEPRIVIPMYYAFPGFTALPVLGAEKFLAEVGASSAPEEKLTIKKKEVPQEETKIVLLHPVASKSL